MKGSFSGGVPLTNIFPDNNDLIFQTRRWHRVFTIYTSYILAQYSFDLHPNSVSIFQALKNGPVAVTQLAELLGCDRTTLSRILPPLVEKGYLVLEKDRDSRKRVYKLTPSGAAMSAHAQEGYEKLEQLIKYTIGEPKYKNLLALLDTATKGLLSVMSVERSDCIESF